MDRADEIMAVLEDICSSLGVPLELDRNYNVNADDYDGVPSDFPLLVLRTGEEETAEGARPQSWDARWIMRPRVDFYLRELDSAKQRAELARVWNDFRAGLKASRILQLISRGSSPVVRREIDPVVSRRDLVTMTIELELAFER